MQREPAAASDPLAVSEQVKVIWNDVLDPPDELPGRTFLELNGQSIAALRIVSRIQDQLGIDVDVEALFDDPSLDAFIGIIAARLALAGRAPGQPAPEELRRS